MAGIVYVLPDPLLCLLQYLRARSEVTALVTSANIITELPPNPSYPYVLLTWAGGDGIWPAIDEAAIQVDVVGGTKPACGLLARTVRAAVWAIRNDTVAAGTLASGSEEIAPQWMPDEIPVPPVPRYTARYRIITFP